MKKLFSLFCIVAFTASLLPASTMGYWRFEDSPGFLEDSSGNGHTLTTFGSGAVQAAIPGSGNGSDFPSAIPQTNAANASLADLTGTKFLHAGDAFSVTDFTIEAYVNFDTYSNSTQYFVSQALGGDDERSYAFGLADNSGGTGPAAANTLFILLSEDGTNNDDFLASGLALTVDTDYYIAVSYDESNLASGVTFYLQDLTNDGSLLTSTVAHAVTSLHDSAANIIIGGTDGANKLDGYMDEVRISDSVLSSSELLVSIPEPSSIALLGLAMAGLYLGHSRKQK